ncbi:MAG TPA: urea ABC transporter permease subunit UrtC, partial [Polyangiaceae bacterium]
TCRSRCPMIERLTRIQSRSAWFMFGAIAVLLLVAVPLGSRAVIFGRLMIEEPTLLLMGKFACYAMVAIAVDLVWGFAGILSLGHGVFFALGGYAIGMNLMLSSSGQGVYRSKLPDFMVFLDWKELPWFWHGFEYLSVAILMAVLVPMLLAAGVGYLAFRSRIRGVYLSLITQALTLALMLLFFRNETGFGGNNGLTDFKTLYGYPLATPSTKLFLYLLAVSMLILIYLMARFIVQSRFGAVLRSIRDVETKVRFCGYDSMRFKLSIWTISAGICGIAGALYVPLVGIINPSEMQPSNSIEMVIWVAVGGRGTLAGAALGAAVVNAAKSWFTAAAPNAWLYFLGSIFVLVTLLLPDGLVSLRRHFKGRRVA